MIHFRHNLLLFCPLLALLFCSSCGKSYNELAGYAQGGIWTVKCSGGDIGAEQLKEGLDSILAVIDRAVSGYNPGSLLSKYNAGIKITDDGSAEYGVFRDLCEFCASIYIATGGVVDCRAAALYDIWGFGFKNGQMPDEAAVKAAMKDRSKLNFNAVAQGYSADLMAEYLKRHGVQDMLVNIGGEMFCRGLNPKGEPWSIGIDTPRDGNNEPGKDLSRIFRVRRECAVVTSGNYRKFYVRDGIKYSHSIDPRTGRPVSHNLLSATVIAPSSALADALATYCMVVGMDEARQFILSREDLEACLISGDGIWESPGFGDTTSNR